MALIEIAHLSKVFYPARPFGAWLRAPWQRGEPIRALDDVSLTIERGELLCLMGSNGAGKTTLLKTLVGLLLPSSGTILLNGHPIRRERPAALRSQIGFASSDRPGFYDQLTGRQNLEFFGALTGLSGRSLRHRIEELGERLDIRWVDRQYQACSAGMKQRLLLAKALLHEPPILLLDEPTKSLDPLQAHALLGLLRDWCDRRDKTILTTTHQVWEAERLAGRIGLLHQGVLRDCGMLERGTLDSAIQRLCR